MNCTLKVARGLNYCWRRLPQAQNLPGQVRLLSHRRFEWRSWNTEPPSQMQSHLHRFDNPSMEEHMDGQPMASSQRRGPVWEPGRRTIMQDPEEHQRRQQQIIEENKRRWSRGNVRRDAQAPGISRPDLIYDADNKPKREQSRPRRRSKDPDRAAKDYSRKRRRQRMKEVKRQAYELKKSRRGYNLPGSDSRAANRDEDRGVSRHQDEIMSRGQDEAQAQYEHYGASEEWLRRRDEAEEAKYWHTWHTCPSQRCDENLESSGDLGHGPKRPPHGYYDSRRGFHHMQLPSIRSPDYQMIANRLVNRRKPIGIEKKYHMLMQKQAEEEWLEHESVVEKKAPHYVLRKRSESAKMERLVKPPRFDMTVTRVKRPPAPVCSFSEQLNIRPPTYECARGTCASLCEKWRQYSSLQKSLRRGG